MSTNTVVKAEIWFHTTDDNKDSDSIVGVDIVLGSQYLVLGSLIDELGEFDDHTTNGPYTISLDSRYSIQLDDFSKLILRIGISAQGFEIPDNYFTRDWRDLFYSPGYDEWHFNFTIRFTCQDGSRFTGSVEGVKLGGDDNNIFKDFKLNEIGFTRFNAWFNLDGKIKDAPAVVMPTRTSQDICVRGMDDRLWRIWWNGTAWSDWEQHNDGDFRLGSAPAVVSNGANHRDIFVRGTDGALYHKYWDGTWHGWFSLGGEIKDAPTVVMLTRNSQDIYVRGMDDRLWRIWWNGSAWSNWEQHDDGDFRLGSAPAVISNGVNHRDVYVRGTDGILYHKYWDGKTWRP